MSSALLNECRCVCGKLLFKGFLCQCVVEVKCRRCGITTSWGYKEPQYLLIQTNAAGDIEDTFGYRDQSFVGRPVSELAPFLHDGLAVMPEGTYKLKEHALILRDGRESRAESCIVPRYVNGTFAGHRIFSIPK